MNVPSLVEAERRSNVSRAVHPSSYAVLCVTESWPNSYLDDYHSYLADYRLYPGAGTMSNNRNLHGGVFIAVKHSISSSEISGVHLKVGKH